MPFHLDSRQTSSCSLLQAPNIFHLKGSGGWDGTPYRCPAALADLAAAACARSFSTQAVNAARVASLRVRPWPAAIILMLRFSFSERRTCSRFWFVVGVFSFIFISCLFR